MATTFDAILGKLRTKDFDKAGSTMTGLLQINVPTTTSEALILKTTDDNTTKNLLEIKNSSGGVLASIGPTGKWTPGEHDGWNKPNETWTYASATTITVPSGAASKYAVGDKIKLTQTGVKYFYVVGVADTVLTVTGGTDYTVANATITDNYYSHDASPIGFPQFFAYTPTVSASSGTFTDVTGVASFSVQGRTCYYKVEITTADVGTAATETRVTLPIAAVENEKDIGSGLERWNTGDALVIRPISSTVAGIRNYVNGFSGANNSIQICSLSYEI